MRTASLVLLLLLTTTGCSFRNHKQMPKGLRESVRHDVDDVTQDYRTHGGVI